MLYSKRGAFLLGIAAFILTLLYLHSTHSPSWYSLPRVVGLGKLVSHNDTTDRQDEQSSDNPRFKSSAKSGFFGVNTADPKSSQFVPGHAKPPGSNYTRSLVVAKRKKEEADWIEDENIGDIVKMVYVVDDNRAPLHPPKNKGHEVMVYLSYIIDHYDDLPDVSIFMHAHQYAWHNNELLNNNAAEMVKRLSSERVLREGYMNLRCHWMPGCPDWMRPGTVDVDDSKLEQTALAQAWAELFPDKPLPEVLAQPCCAQFALSRERIQAVSKDKYLFYRDWLLRTSLRDQISGRVWEYLWQVVFTGQSIACPNQWSCYCDGYGVCFENEESFDYWFQLKWRKHTADSELAEWQAKADKIEKYRSKGILVGIEGGDIQVPKVGRDVELMEESSKIEELMEEGRIKAIERGTDPKFRAYSAGRKWSDGDGY